MRIIDKHEDFYDYVQYLYSDNTFTFDRTGSEILSKDVILHKLSGWIGDYEFMLLQVGNRFWLCAVEVTKINKNSEPTDYTLHCLAQWSNYNKVRILFDLSLVSFDWKISRYVIRNSYDEEIVTKYIDSMLVPVINNNDYRVKPIYRQPTHKKEAGDWRFPILKEAKFNLCVEPIDIFLAIEEYFSLEAQDAERTESIGLTDTEKIENHGFDTKISFRGKTT